MKNFEMAHSDDPEEIIKATQRALLASMQDIIAGIKKDLGGPGLTWTQIDFFFEEFKKKQPTIVTQAEEM